MYRIPLAGLFPCERIHHSKQIWDLCVCEESFFKECSINHWTFLGLNGDISQSKLFFCKVTFKVHIWKHLAKYYILIFLKSSTILITPSIYPEYLLIRTVIWVCLQFFYLGIYWAAASWVQCISLTNLHLLSIYWLVCTFPILCSCHSTMWHCLLFPTSSVHHSIPVIYTKCKFLFNTLLW